MVCTWDKGFTQLIWHEQSDASRTTVNKCRLHDRPQIRFGGHMADRIVNKDRIKVPAQPWSSYVSLKVFALGIQRSIDRQHLRRHVHESQREVCFEMEGVDSAAGPKIEHGARRRIGRLSQQAIKEQSLFPILGRIRHDRPPFSQFVVKLHYLSIDTLQRARRCSHASATRRDRRRCRPRSLSWKDINHLMEWLPMGRDSHYLSRDIRRNAQGRALVWNGG